MGVRGQRHAPAAPYTRERLGTQLHRRLGGPQGRSGQVRKISPTSGFAPRTFQPVGCRYTDYDTRPILSWFTYIKFTDWLQYILYDKGLWILHQNDKKNDNRAPHSLPVGHIALRMHIFRTLTPTSLKISRCSYYSHFERTAAILINPIT